MKSRHDEIRKKYGKSCLPPLWLVRSCCQVIVGALEDGLWAHRDGSVSPLGAAYSQRCCCELIPRTLWR